MKEKFSKSKIKISVITSIIIMLFMFCKSSIADNLKDKEAFVKTKIKLAFIYKFIEFIDGDWEFATADNQVIISVYGNFANEELEMLMNYSLKNVKNTPVKIQYNPNIKNSKNSDIVFFTKGSDAKIAKILRNTRKDILSIGDINYFTDKGGIIELSEYRGKLRFKIDNEGAKKRGIMFNAKLLELSER